MPRRPPARRLPLFDRSAKLALIILCVLLVAARVGLSFAVDALNVYFQKQPVETRDAFQTIPDKIGDWTSTGDEILTAEMTEELGTEIYVSRTYVSDGETGKRALHVHVAYYTGMIDAVPHVPDRCFVAGGLNTESMPELVLLPVAEGGWEVDELVNRATGAAYRTTTYRDTFGRSQIVRLPVGDFKLRAREFSDPARPEARIYAGYFFIANGRIAHTPEDVKLLAFKRSEQYAYYCKVQFASTGGPNFELEDFTAMSTGFLDELLPELMRCLPDWSEIETLQSAGATDTSEI